MAATIRPPAVAGTFYPADPHALRRTVRACLDAALPAADLRVKALVVPHAGYLYSGGIAGRAYAQLRPLRRRFRRVVLLGPSHRVGFRGLAVPEADAFETPLGEIPVDADGVARALALPQVHRLDAAHAREHSLEVQLPFLQLTLEGFSLVPLVVGDATPSEIAEVIEALWDDDETLVIVSSDLSHYLSYEEARSLDGRTTRAIERLAPEEIGREQACGRLPVQGLLLVARRRGLHAHVLDVRSSGDTAGPRDSVVGYGAFAFTADPPSRRPGGLEPLLLVARGSIEHGLREGVPLPVDPMRFDPPLREKRASFTTLHVGGALRGCTGSLEPTLPLVEDVARNAFRAAFHDSRFAPIGALDLPSLRVHVSVLGPLEPLRVASEAELVAVLRPGVDGLVLEDGTRRATFLPAVWKQLPSPLDFVRHLQRKAGLPALAFTASTRAFRYGVEEVEDPPQ